MFILRRVSHRNERFTGAASPHQSAPLPAFPQWEAFFTLHFYYTIAAVGRAIVIIASFFSFIAKTAPPEADFSLTDGNRYHTIEAQGKHSESAH